MFRANLQRTGVYDAKQPSEPVGGNWRFKTKGVVRSSPLIADGTAYFGSDDRHLYAVDIQTGLEKWRFETAGSIVSSPTITKGIVFFGSREGYLYAVDAISGQEKWRFRAKGSVSSSPALVGEVVYFGCGYRYLYALDINTGLEKWHFEADKAEGEISTPAIADGGIYFGSPDGLCALDVETGDVKWKFKTKGDMPLGPAISGGTVFCVSDDVVYAVNAKTGKEMWNVEIAGEGTQSSPAVSDSVVYFLGTAFHSEYCLYAVDASTGAAKWKFSSFGVRSSPSISAGVVYFGGGHWLFAVNADTRQEKWRFETGDAIRSSPVISGGVIYVGCDDGYMYAIQLNASQYKTPESTWETFWEAAEEADIELIKDCLTLRGPGRAEFDKFIQETPHDQIENQKRKFRAEFKEATATILEHKNVSEDEVLLSIDIRWSESAKESEPGPSYRVVFKRETDGWKMVNMPW